MNHLIERISITPDVCEGAPTIRNTRIGVQTILGLLSSGNTHAEILEEYPSLEMDDIDACLAYISDMVYQQYLAQAIT